MIAECPWCKRKFERKVGGSGRPRKYCSDECRIARLRAEFQPAWNERQRKARLANTVRYR